MIRNSGSRNPNSHHNSNPSSSSSGSSSLIQGLKRLANPQSNNSQTHQRIEIGDISSPKKVSVPSRVSNASDLRPLQHSRTPSQQSQSKYTYSRRASAVSQQQSYQQQQPYQQHQPYQQQQSYQHQPQYQHQAQYQQQQIPAGSTGGVISRQQTNHSHATSQSSAVSIVSQGSFSNLNRFIRPDGKIRLEMPQDYNEVEGLFEDILYKRNIMQTLPPEKQQELRNYDIDKKWLIVKQDLQNDLKKMISKSSVASHTSADSTVISPTTITSAGTSEDMPDNVSGVKVAMKPSASSKTLSSSNSSINTQQANGSTSSTAAITAEKTNRPPIYYVRKIIADELSTDETNDLWVTLRTEQLDWVDAFLEHQGHIAMANVLTKSLYKVSQEQKLSDKALERETSYFKCFRVLVMLSQGLYEFTKHPIMAETVAYALFSTRLTTRKMATEIFVCMLEKRNKMRFDAILNALDKKFLIGENLHMVQYVRSSPHQFVHLKRDSQFKIVQAWLTSIESTLQGRGKMGSLVGASEDFKAPGGENSILEYSQWTMVFINHLCMGTDVINQRVLLRTRLENAGALRIMNRFKLLDYDKLTAQVEYYENGKLDDINNLLEAEGESSQVNMKDPMMMLQKMWDYCKGTENEKTFTSLIQHLFLSSSKVAEDKGDPSKLAKQLRLMDSLVANVSISAVDEESSMNMAIQRLYDAMQTDEVARRAILESRSLTKELEEIQAERDFLRQKLNSTGDGIVGRLEEELRQRDDILAKNQRVNRHLQSELEELKKKHLLEKHEHEVELRKMLTILNARPDDENSANTTRYAKPVSKMDSEKQSSIQKALQDGLQRTRKDLTVDSKRFGITVQPNKRLRMLRMKMEGIEQEARQLEMTNFSDHEKRQLHEPVQVKRDDSLKQANVRKLSYLRKQLTDIQKETNDVSKFNVEERVREMFNQKRLQALKKLQELEMAYKDFGIEFNANELLESKGAGPSLYDQDIDVQDMNAAQSKMDEMDRITSEIAVAKANLETQKQTQQLQQQQRKQQTDSSSTESSSEDDEDSTVARNDTASEFSQKSFGSGAGSFLEALSQKYGSGQNAGGSVSPTQGNFNVIRKNSNHRTSFANRMKKSGSVTPYFDELTRKVTRAPSLKGGADNIPDRDPDDDDTLPATSPKLVQSIDDTIPRNNISTSSPVSTAPHPAPAPAPPPLPEMLSSNADSAAKPEDKGESAPPPPPPPPPPMPSFGEAAIKGPISIPAPPLPPGLDASGSNSPSPSPPPPPPPLFAGQKKMYRSEMPNLLEETTAYRDSYPQPHKKLKQLHWEKLDATEDSIWSSGVAEKFAGDLYEKGVLAGLEKAFAAREIKSLASRKKDDLTKVSFLTHDISQQFGINLHMYSQMSVNDLVTKILKCERDFLQTPSVIEFLSKPDITEVSVNLARNFSPYSTDWDGIRSAEDAKPPEKDPNDLQRADQIYLQLIFNLQAYWGSRMRALKVITTYDKEYQELVSKLRKVDKAVGSILKSENLRNIFNVILAVGNFMNDTAKRAQGFKLSTLQRLTFIKDSSNSMTFLNYVEKVIRDNYPSFNDFLNELEPVLDVTKISIDQLINDCRDYSQAVLNVERSIEIGNLSDSSKFHPLDKVLIKVLPVLPEARKKCDLLDDEVRLSIMEFENLMQKYGEDSGDKFAKNTFFKKFADFVQEYKKAQNQNMKVEEEERVYERHKKMVEEQQKREQTPPRKTSRNDEEGGDDGDDTDRRGMMDKLLDQLKNAGPTTSDPSSARKRAMVRRKLLADKDAAAHLISDLESGEDSIVYSPSSPHEEPVHEGAGSPTLHKSQSSSLNLHSTDKASPIKHSTSQEVEGEEEEISDKAKSLLMELSGDGTPTKRSDALNGHKEKLRARRRRTHTRDEMVSGNKLSFLDDETPPVTPVEVEFNKENIDLQLRQHTQEVTPSRKASVINAVSGAADSSEGDYETNEAKNRNDIKDSFSPISKGSL